MYWNGFKTKRFPFGNKINRNMRCIEILPHDPGNLLPHGLIETWDVLKLARPRHEKQWSFWLIETWDVLKSEQKTGKVRAFPGLIETWDVLKCSDMDGSLVSRPD